MFRDHENRQAGDLIVCGIIPVRYGWIITVLHEPLVTDFSLTNAAIIIVRQPNHQVLMISQRATLDFTALLGTVMNTKLSTN